MIKQLKEIIYILSVISSPISHLPISRLGIMVPCFVLLAMFYLLDLHELLMWGFCICICHYCVPIFFFNSKETTILRHPTMSHVMCHLSLVTCDRLCVTCHISPFTYSKSLTRSHNLSPIKSYTKGTNTHTHKDKNKQTHKETLRLIDRFLMWVSKNMAYLPRRYDIQTTWFSLLCPHPPLFFWSFGCIRLFCTVLWSFG